MSDLTDKVVVVTGGGGLLGGMFARGIVKAGGIAVIADIDEQVCSKVETELQAEFPGKVVSAHLDITDEHSIDGLLITVHKKLGCIDAVVNCAYPRNHHYGRRLEEVTYEDFCENVSLHLGGYFAVMKKFFIYFSSLGSGNIINIASIYGTIAPRFSIYRNSTIHMPIEYAAIKSAVIHLTKYFAQYAKGRNIRVNSLSPGGVLDRQPNQFLEAYNSFCNGKGMLNPNDVSGALLFLISDDSRYITGQNIIVDDGFSL